LLGIRPDDIEVAKVTEKTEQGSTNRFPALIDAVESIGSESKLSLLTGAHALVCRSQRQVEQREAGHRSQFKLNTEKVCLFDPVSRRRIA
jgi:ABC-type sugar transport system ATPase subunit